MTENNVIPEKLWEIHIYKRRVRPTTAEGFGELRLVAP